MHSSIHRKVLCDKIPAFKQELQRLQPNQNVLDFPEGMGATFEGLIEWTYREKLPEVTNLTTVEECCTIIKLYCLAGKYREVDLMNACMDYIMQYLKKSRPRWDLEWVGYVYENTSRASPLRSLMIKWFMDKIGKTKDKSRWTTKECAKIATHHPDIIYDFFALHRTLSLGVSNPKMDDSSVYHITEGDLSPEPESDFDSRDGTPLTMYTATSPEALLEIPTVESTPPTGSDEEMDTEIVEENHSNFDADSDISASEVDNNHFPTTRSNRKNLRSSKRTFTASA